MKGKIKVIFCFLIILIFMLLGNIGRAHADPILAGSDFGPSSAQLTFTIFGVGTDAVNFTSAGLPDMEIVRQGQDGDNPGTIDTEIVSLELAGTSSTFGGLQLKAGSDFGITPTLGKITEVFTTPGSNTPDAFISGHSFFDVFFEIEVLVIGMTIINTEPHSMEADISSLPPVGDLHFPPLAWEKTWLYNKVDPSQAVGFITASSHVVTPEPTTIALLGIGLVGLAGVDVRRRSKRKQLINAK